jgi:hypothetical protein
MNRPPNKISRSSLFNAIMLIGLLGITFYPLLLTGFLTRDDAERHLAVLTGGIFSELAGIGEATGRLTLVFHLFFTHIPYLSDNIIYRKVLLILPHIIVVSSFAFTILKYLNSRAVAFGFVVLFLVFFTNSWEHSLYASYPFAFHVSMLGVISAAYFLYRYIETYNGVYTLLSACSYGLAIFTYEQFLPYVVFLVGLIFMHPKLIRQKSVKERAAAALPFLALFAIYLVAILSYKYSVPGRYEGTEVAAFDLFGFLRTLGVFVSSSFPTVIPVIYQIMQKTNFGGLPEYSLSWVWFLNNYEIVWFVKAFFASALMMAALRKSDYLIDGKQLIRHLTVMLVLLLLSVLLISISSKYQAWVKVGAVAYSSSTYFAQLFSAAIISVLLFWIFSLRPLKELPGLAVFLIALFIFIPVTMVIEMHNKNVLASQINSANRWKAIETLVETGEMGAIMPGAIIYAPEFMQTGGIVSMREGYWSSYMKAKYGVDAEITGNINFFYRPEIRGKLYKIKWLSRPPYKYFSAHLEEVSGLYIHVPDNEQTGFYDVEKDQEGYEFRWSKKQSSISLCNTDAQNITSIFTGTVLTDAPRDEPLRVCFSGQCSSYKLGNIPTKLRETITLPPGCHKIEFVTDAAAVNAPLDSRRLYFQVRQINLNQFEPGMGK